mmetsp:Transcript_27135/g.42615  ORF Transcript_27135/g.42615 Transcript_27135/m.42615 type:complete len:168 (+) Transcript_27135:187-690(+)
MANAAAKKAAAARQSASSTYLPIVAALNLLYLILFAAYKRASLTTFQGVMVVTLVGLSYLSYRGVVENHGNHDFKSDALAGGAFLDMMGLVSVVQFGSVLLSDKFYWLLLLIPTVGGWKIYSSVKGGLPGMPNTTNTAASSYDKEQVVSEKDKERRQKRAEQRRRKW